MENDRTYFGIKEDSPTSQPVLDKTKQKSLETKDRAISWGNKDVGEMSRWILNCMRGVKQKRAPVMTGFCYRGEGKKITGAEESMTTQDSTGVRQDKSVQYATLHNRWLSCE